MPVSSRSVLITSGVVAAVILVMASVGSWLSYQIISQHAETPAVRALAQVTQFPVARVGTDWISYREYLVQSDAQAKYLKGAEARTLNLPLETTPTMQQAVLDQLVRNAVIERLAKQYDFKVSTDEVDRSYQDLIARAGTSTQPGEVQAYLEQSFGWTETEFKKYIVQPALLQNGLGQKRQADTGKEETFEAEITAALAAPNVKKWLTFTN